MWVAVGEDCSAMKRKERRGVTHAWGNTALLQGRQGQGTPPKARQQATFMNMDPVQAGGDT